jgi:excisionase family DNA binding protein
MTTALFVGKSGWAMIAIKEDANMSEEMMEQRIQELNAKSATAEAPQRSEKRTYSVDDIMEILDIGRSTAYLLVKRNLFRSMKIGNQIRISKASFDSWLDNG